jgi:hypothetical protein
VLKLHHWIKEETRPEAATSPFKQTTNQQKINLTCVKKTLKNNHPLTLAFNVPDIILFLPS